MGLDGAYKCGNSAEYMSQFVMIIGGVILCYSQSVRQLSVDRQDRGQDCLDLDSVSRAKTL